MAGIFNLFGETPESNRGQLVKLSRSNSSLGINEPVGKSIGLSKSKGLSIRSNSDLNVPVTPRINLKQDVSRNKQLQSLNPKLTQLDHSGRPISPSKEHSAKKVNSKKSIELTAKIHTLEEVLKAEKSSDEVVFKKPLPPKKMKKPMYPEPESLAPYYNFQNELEDIYSKQWDTNFTNLIQNTQIKLYEDEGFESDPEQLPPPDIPALSISTIHSEEEWGKVWSPKLPSISDDEF